MEEVKLTEEQVKQVKEQLLTQINNFPEDKREQIKQQINSMNTEEIEEFVKQNQLNHLDPNKCIFCSIIEGKTPSIKIDEDKENIAILEINPLTKGHTIIIPKNHSDSPSREFATKVAETLQQKLNAKDIQVQETEVMEHKIMNLIPTYENTDLEKAKRTQAKKEDLENLQQELTTPKIEIQPPQQIQQPTPQETKQPEPIPKLPPRIP
tara:strand:- start:301 stop:927 length:627 start_codon:yes stop_codon:yes gene_type:complete